MIIVELVANACIAFTGFYLISRWLNYKQIRESQSQQFWIGVIGGLLGFFLMYLAVSVSQGVRIDMRHIPLLLFSLYGLHTPLLVSSVMIAITRFYFGVDSQATVAFFGTLGMGLGLLVLHRFLLKHSVPTINRALLLNFFALMANSIILFINIDPGDHPLGTITVFWGVGTLIGLITTFLILDIKQVQEDRTRFRQNANIDFLTSIGNVRTWDQEVNIVENRHRKIPFPLAVLLFDIDYFKRVNDTYGHDNGDLILKQFAQLLQRHLIPKETTARIGGEEFAMLILSESKEIAMRRAEEIRTAVEAFPFKLNSDESIKITISTGGVFSNTDSHQITIFELKSLADEALYMAKHSGRNQVIFI